MTRLHPLMRTINRLTNQQWLWIASFILVTLYTLTIWRQQSTIINGRFAVWLHDDMMISMRYAQNLAQGHGLVWNAGQPPVEGYSNPAWVLVMAAVHWLPLPSTLTSLVMLLINMGIALWILRLTARLYQQWQPEQPTWVLFLTLLTLTLIIDLFRWTIIGLETPLQTAVFLWLLLRLLQEREQEQLRPLTFFLMGLLGFIRVDGFVLSGLLCLFALIVYPQKGRVLLYSGLALILPLLNVGFRLVYYGYPLPNTYYLKITEWDRWGAGLAYALRFLTRYGWAWLLAGWGVWHSQDSRARALWLISLPLLLYVIYVGGDDFGGLRFMAPWLPILLTLTFLTPYWSFNATLQKAAPPLMLLLFGLTTGFNFITPEPAAERIFLQTGLALDQHLLPESSVAHYWAGATPYFSQRLAVDLLGKNDATIARTPAHAGSNKPGHNKFDYTYSLTQQQPDLIVAPVHPSALTATDALATLSQGDDAYAGQLYQHPQFQQHYAANLIFIGDMALFIHNDSPEKERLMQGDCKPFTNDTLLTLGLRDACWPLDTEQ